MILKRALFLIACLAVAFGACKKNQADGPSEISGRVVHHEKAIPGATIYIKFNAKEWPGRDSSVYDHTLKADAQGNFIFKCYKGDYYLYATGIEPRAVPLYVSGGIPVSLRHKEKKDVELAVTEQH
jgi:hypothetical protein